ncbi:Zinc finger CCCH domain-containing [Lecanosticta acicola]|uniref:Zinc finger CCCH domain-containing n=1 Tax=Lecanosticta acicola TaxID=111012 RepID=A0AAI8YUN6_9PEZI|nr:Zinc finger CCCH domain-containing [Lecanosticta acicola]
MSDEAELQAKIAALAGKINQHKQQPSALAPNHYGASHPPHHASHNDYRGYDRWTPYGHAARGGRGGRGSFHRPHKNRTLVLGGAQTGSPAAAAATAAVAEEQSSVIPPTSNASEAFVSTRSAGMNQLMTKDTYDREQQVKREPQEKHTRQGIYRSPTTTNPSASQHRVLELEGIKFKVAHDGSKLFRVDDPMTAHQETPKKARITGVDFVRTKHGNLLKLNPAKDGKRPVKRKPQCENFTKYGTCSFGPACKFDHDPTKVAICKEWLRNGWCKPGANCDMSHDSSYHRVSACTHFLRGNCTNRACRYPHVNVSPSAPVCRPFATLGYCAKGEQCENRHVCECPDYANRGVCAAREKGKCQLPHIDRAGTLRKTAKRQSKTGTDEESDVSSDNDDSNEDSRVVIHDDSDGPEDEDEQGTGFVDDDTLMALDTAGSDRAVKEQESFISLIE